MDRENYILLLTASIFLSISLFEILLVLGLLFAFYEFFKEKQIQKGILLKPILVFSGVSIFSTVLFNPLRITKGIEEGLFQLIYIFKVNREKVLDLGKKTTTLFIIFGFVLYPIAVYRYLKEGVAHVIWGSSYEAGHFYSIFSLTSLILSFYFYRKEKPIFYFFVALYMVFSLIIVLSFRRTEFLEFFVGTVLVAVIFFKNRLINKKVLAAVFSYLFVFSVFDYWFLSKNDYRFKEMNKMLLQKEISEKELNRISSRRYHILLDAIDIIKEDIKEKRVLNLLFGHGVRSGAYLPHKRSKKTDEKYESFFVISEFIEKGLVGTAAVLFIMFLAFKRFLKLKIVHEEQFFAVVLFLPLILHLIGVTFTFFWDALLPLYFLLFKAGEVYFGEDKTI